MGWECYPLGCHLTQFTWNGRSIDFRCDGSLAPLRPHGALIDHTVYSSSSFSSSLFKTISISPDGKWIATGSWDETVRIWGSHDATLHCVLHCPGQVWSVDFSPMNQLTIWNYGNL